MCLFQIKKKKKSEIWHLQSLKTKLKSTPRHFKTLIKHSTADTTTDKNTGQHILCYLTQLLQSG